MFNGPYWFYVEGNLTAQGTTPEPIIFTSNLSTPSPSDWLNVMVNSTGRVYVENASFSYGNAPLIFYYSENNTVINCTFHDNFDPITIFRSNNNTFSRSEVRDNPNDAGMIIEDSQENQILNSTFVNNKYGIVLRIGASNNTITHNRVRNHSMFGVEAEAGSFSNLIFYNDFVNNSVSGRDTSGGSNYWDNGYPSGGNFWDDYSGVDNFSGPNQDQPGSDGIGDSWYAVAPSGIDHYPIMEPLFPTAENKPPEITGMSILPPLQESGLDVNISAYIMDDDLVMDAHLEVRLPDTTTTNESMMLEGLSTYYLNATYSQPGTYHFNVSAIDSEGLWNSSGGTFVVVDTTNPWIVDVSANPDVQEVYVPVNISATLQDNDLVSFVSFNMSCPDNSWRNLTPSNNAQDLYWEETSFDTLGQYNGSVTAIDRSGNSNSSSFIFNILDSTSPSILALQASHSSQEVSSYVNITAVVQDNFALESVFLNVSFPSGTHSNVSMIESIPSEYFLNSTYHEVGDHSATVWATDTSGNAATQSLSFLMVDGFAPTITSVSAIPDLQDYGGNVNISAQVSDNHMLEYVRLNLSFPDTSSAVYEMSEGEPGVYYINQSHEFIGVAQFKIEAADPSGNEQTYPGSFEMRDMSPPEIFSAYASPSNQEAGQVVALIADVWDNRQIWGVWADVIHPDNSRSNNSMNWNETSQLFEFKAVHRMHGLHRFTVWTNDSTDNWNHLENTFTVEDTVAPEIVSVLVSPNPQEIRREVAIDVTAVDNGQISVVYVELEKPESGEIENVSCVSIDGEDYSAVFTPTELGTYRLLIYVLDTAGNSRTSETDLQSEDTTPPTADAGGDRIVERGHNVSLDASLSQDNHRIGTYNWTFVDGEETKLLEGVHATYAFSRTGNYSVTLATKDPSGNVDTDTITLTVKDTIPPAPPQSLAVSRGGEPYSLVLSWSANVEDDLDHYIVLRSLQKYGEYEPIGTPSEDSTSFEDTGLVRGTTYWYALVAVDESGNPSVTSERVSGVVEGAHADILLYVVVTLVVVFAVVISLLYLRRKRRKIGNDKKVDESQDVRQ